MIVGVRARIEDMYYKGVDDLLSVSVPRVGVSRPEEWVFDGLPCAKLPLRLADHSSRTCELKSDERLGRRKHIVSLYL